MFKYLFVLMYLCVISSSSSSSRYCFLAYSWDERVVASKESCRLLLVRLSLDGWALGKTKVFLKCYHVEHLSKLYEDQVRKM